MLELNFPTWKTVGAAVIGSAIFLIMFSQPSWAVKSPVTHQVIIKNFGFSPASLSIRQGDTVEWVNHDIVPHTATQSGRKWDTDKLNNKQSFQVTFPSLGQEVYGCLFHTNMQAEIIITND